jgi:DNA-binding winged helix-turn-helix (wHTH) protein
VPGAGISSYATKAPKPPRERMDTRGESATAWSARIIGDDPVEALRFTALRLAAASSPHGIAAVLAEVAAGTTRAEAVVIGVWDELSSDLRIVYEHGLAAHSRQRLPAALSTFARVAQTDGAALEALAEPLLAPALWDCRPSPAGREAFAALIPPRERPLGIVLVGRAHGGPFSLRERRFLNALAAIAALELEPVGSARDRRDAAAGSHVQRAGMQIDLADQEVIFDDRHVHLTPSELRILLFLADEPGRARTRREILRHVWHTEHVGDERACDAHISNLRRKIERDPSRPSRVVTIRNVGYALRVPRIS